VEYVCIRCIVILCICWWVCDCLLIFLFHLIMLSFDIIKNNSCTHLMFVHRMCTKLQVLQPNGFWQVWPSAMHGGICLQFGLTRLRQWVYKRLLLVEHLTWHFVKKSQNTFNRFQVIVNFTVRRMENLDLHTYSILQLLYTAACTANCHSHR